MLLTLKKKKTQALVVEEYFLVAETNNTYYKDMYSVPENFLGIRDIWPQILTSPNQKLNPKSIYLVAKF